MKKYLILAVAALVASVACSKVENDETPDVKIGYQVANYSIQTKTADNSFLTELSSLGVTSGQAFKSAAYINADDGAGSTTLNEFFNPSPETISWNADATEWAPGKDYYWPKSPNSNIDFFSWYDYENGSNPTLTYDGDDASLVWSNRTVAYKSDILFANVAWHQKANTKPAQYGGSGVSEGVPTLFHHALAQVKFTVAIKTGCDKKVDSHDATKYTFWDVTLSDVKIVDDGDDASIHKNGTLTLAITDPETKTVAEPWTLPTNSIWADATSPIYINTATDWFTTNAATGAAVLTTTPASLNATTYMPDNYLAVRPQAVTDDMLLNFTMTITKYHGTTTEYAKANHGECVELDTEVIAVKSFATTDTEDAYTDDGLLLNKIGPAYWAMNTRVAYNIIIDPTTTTILFDPAVEAWTTDDDNDVEVPKPAV